MPRDVDFGPIFTDSVVGAKNAKNTREKRMKSKGKTQDTNTHNTITSEFAPLGSKDQVQ